MNKNVPQTVLITGATSGIGLELAKIFAQNGHNLILAARREQELGDVARQLMDQYKISAYVFPVDLSEAGAAENLYTKIKSQGLTVDILVNNAGFAEYGFFTDIALEKDLKVIQLNIVSPTALTKLALADMLYRHQGKILNVASTAAFQPGPLMAVYYATKAYVLSLDEALTNELAGTGITMTTLCPGPTKTGFQKQADMKGVRLVDPKNLMSAKDVAQAGYKGLMRGKSIVIPGFKNKLLVQSLRIAPRKLVLKILRYLQERKK